jgi:hypothetical protein
MTMTQQELLPLGKLQRDESSANGRKSRRAQTGRAARIDHDPKNHRRTRAQRIEGRSLRGERSPIFELIEGEGDKATRIRSFPFRKSCRKFSRSAGAACRSNASKVSAK